MPKLRGYLGGIGIVSLPNQKKGKRIEKLKIEVFLCLL